MPHSNHHVTILHVTLKWPEGPQDSCAVCGKPLRVGQRVCVVDTAFHQQRPDDGLYAHALCMQEECKEQGWYDPVKSHGS